MKEFTFYDNVYDVVRLIPKGRVTTYGSIANYLGMNKSARIVGWALNSSRKNNIPAHRVVNRNGILTGKNNFNNPDEMRVSLEKEGAVIVEDKIVNFKTLYWDPSQELL